MLAFRKIHCCCNSRLQKFSPEARRCVKILQIKTNCLYSTNNVKEITVHVNERPALPSVGLMQQRLFATKSEEDVKDLERIYYGTLTPRMKAVKVFSLTTSLTGLAAQPILMEQGMKLGGTGMAVFLCSFAGVFTFVTPFLLHLITKKYVTEIYYNPVTEEYVATTVNIILQKVRTKFRASDVKIPEVPGMFTSFNVGNKPLFVDPALFGDPEHYIRIMGYDKPIDFKLDLKETNVSAERDSNKLKNKY